MSKDETIERASNVDIGKGRGQRAKERPKPRGCAGEGSGIREDSLGTVLVREK